MRRFDQVTYNATSKTVTVGAGNLWDNVYAKLGPLGVNVLGGRVSGMKISSYAGVR